MHSIDYRHAELTGDIRYDRVSKLALNTDRFEKIESFCEGKKVFMAGSSWPSDEKVFLPYLISAACPYKSIIAPHDISDSHIEEILKNSRGNAIRLSHFDRYKGEKILIVDRIGILSRIYKYAEIAFIGGAFKEGLHNVLEPAAYGVGVLSGPDFKGFPEAPEMEKAGALIRVKDRMEFESLMERLAKDKDALSRLSDNARNFISKRKGATQKSLKAIEEELVNPSI